jgi:hypothetical protein
LTPKTSEPPRGMSLACLEPIIFSNLTFPAKSLTER